MDVLVANVLTSSPSEAKANRTMELIACNLASYVVRKYTVEPPPRPNGRYQKVLDKATQWIVERHQIVFRGAIQKLNLKEDSNLEEFRLVADQVTSDGRKSWGRIAAVLTFGGLMGRELSARCAGLPEAERDQRCQTLVQGLTEYLVQSQGEWILQQGGWDDMVRTLDADRSADDSGWGATFVYAGLLVGLGALYKIYKS